MHAEPFRPQAGQPVLQQGRYDEDHPDQRPEEYHLDRRVAVLQPADAGKHRGKGQSRDEHPESAPRDGAAPVRNGWVRNAQSS